MNDNQQNEQNEQAWRLVGASVEGTSHLKTGMGCQDAFRYAWWANGVVLAVSDGAGSAKRAADGAELAVDTAVDSLLDALMEEEPSTNEAWQGMIRRAFGAARARLMQKALQENVLVREYGTTLMVLVLSQQYTIGGLIGDCAAVIRYVGEADELTSICRPQMGEYANMTHFLTQPGALQLLDVQIRAKSAQAVALFSDGLSRLALNLAQNKPYAPFFKPLFAFAATVEDEKDAQAQLEAFLGSERINMHTNDDKTLVLGSRF